MPTHLHTNNKVAWQQRRQALSRPSHHKEEAPFFHANTVGVVTPAEAKIERAARRVPQSRTKRQSRSSAGSRPTSASKYQDIGSSGAALPSRSLSSKIAPSASLAYLLPTPRVSCYLQRRLLSHGERCRRKAGRTVCREELDKPADSNVHTGGVASGPGTASTETLTPTIIRGTPSTGWPIAETLSGYSALSSTSTLSLDIQPVVVTQRSRVAWR